MFIEIQKHGIGHLQALRFITFRQFGEVPFIRLVIKPFRQGFKEVPVFLPVSFGVYPLQCIKHIAVAVVPLTSHILPCIPASSRGNSIAGGWPFRAVGQDLRQRPQFHPVKLAQIHL